MGTTEADPGEPGPIEHGIRYGARAVLEELAEQDEWDLPPVLYAVAQGPLLSPDDDLFAEAPEQVRELVADSDSIGLQMLFVPLPIPDHFWASADAHEVIRAVTAAHKENGARGRLWMGLPDDVRLIGMLLCTEAWMVDRDRATEASPGDDVAPSQDPDAVEVRVVFGADAAGYHYNFSQPRDCEDVRESITGPGLGELPQGRIPDALDDLVEALIDVTTEVL